MKQKFISHLLENHPSLSQKELDELISPQLLSPFELRLPENILKEAKEFVDAVFTLRESPQYQAALSAEVQSYGLKDPGNKSICMSYDFHVDSEGHLKLIEINTNAAFQALGYEMYKMRGMPLPIPDFSMNVLKESIQTELNLHGRKSQSPLSAAIIDEEPEKQKLFAEFLVFKSYFEKWGWPTEIADFRKNVEASFVYNRHTDFYLAQPEAKALREKFLTGKICLSPNPFEYCMLADKQRMIDWGNDRFWSLLSESLQRLRPAIHKNLPLTKDLCSQFSDEIWAERKRFFFKPKRAFGSKQSYRGATISRKMYDDIINQEMIAQEYIPASEVPFETPTGIQKFKYDLRFYVYGSQVQLVLARLYQGQVTNLRTEHGGFTPVLFN